ncbi:hypothetical protein MRB53_014266 [Persea americana]|uniref:Uncharacterized protein n=1 Tax=Persea americana TaxID=3435 RepID=A0ACC2KAF8_PERAE|nr:hypothetical protein MRB53_014266 [Persea americana]
MLPLSINNIPPPLKQIKGSITQWDSLQWDSNNTKMLLQPFFPSAPDRELQRVKAEEEDVVDDSNDEQRGTKRKADVLAERRHLDLNLPTPSMEQEIELSPRNSKKWKTHE